VSYLVPRQDGLPHCSLRQEVTERATYGVMRLAHCSDLHLLSHDGARWLDLANKRWIGAM